MVFDGSLPTGSTQRLHPISLIFNIGRSVRSLLIPGLLFLLLARGSQYELWLMLGFVPAVLIDLIGYFTMQYQLLADELVVRQGLITRNTRHIPYARIQNIDLVQNPLHRLFDVAEVRIETASGIEPEAVLRVLSLEAVERMRQQVFRLREPERAVATAPGGQEVVFADAAVASSVLVVRLSAPQLVAFGLVTDRGWAMLLAGLGVAWQFDVYDYLERTLAAVFPPLSWFATPYVIVGILVSGVVALKLLSVTWALVTLYGFVVTRHGDDLRTAYGLITRRFSTVPRYRIQSLSVLENPLHRYFGHVSVRVQTAGAGNLGGDAVSRQWLAPLTRASEPPGTASAGSAGGEPRGGRLAEGAPPRPRSSSSQRARAVGRDRRGRRAICRLVGRGGVSRGGFVGVRCCTAASARVGVRDDTGGHPPERRMVDAETKRGALLEDSVGVAAPVAVRPAGTDGLVAHRHGGRRRS